MKSTNQESVTNTAQALPMTLSVKNDDGLSSEHGADVLHGALQFRDIQAIYRAMQVIREEGFESITFSTNDSLFAWYQDAAGVNPNRDYLENGDTLVSANSESMDVTSESITVFDGSFVIECSPRYLEPLKMRSVDVPISILERPHTTHFDVFENTLSL